MFLKIKNKLDRELQKYIADLDKTYSLSRISPLLLSTIKEFISRDGKRVRPLLFVIGYLGYAKKQAPGLLRSAISLELLHDFMLVHDDIIDKSALRRGRPSMHAGLNKYLKKKKGLKFNGEDLAIVVGDILYAMAIHSFLAIKEGPRRKEKALRKLCEAAFYTGGGEFVELLSGLKKIDRVRESEINKIYDLKTAEYTFAYPLTMGAVLGGAKDKEIKRLFEYGVFLGRAFQIKDDILGIFGSEKKIGKSVLTDLQEAKKTILIWHAFNNANGRDKLRIKMILGRNNVSKADLFAMRKIILDSGTLDYAKKTISSLVGKSEKINRALRMKKKYKDALLSYSRKLLTLGR